jgi:hypothetical protein
MTDTESRLREALATEVKAHAADLMRAMKAEACVAELRERLEASARCHGNDGNPGMEDEILAFLATTNIGKDYRGPAIVKQAIEVLGWALPYVRGVDDHDSPGIIVRIKRAIRALETGELP